MYKIPFSTKVGIWTAKMLLNKLRKAYETKHQKPLPIVLVAGTAGKSSTTLLIKSLFEKSYYKVITGASNTRCLNSVTGISMVIGGFDLDFEGRGGRLNKLLFVLKSIWANLTKTFDLPEKTVFVYEIGFNEQYESAHFTQIFQNSAQLIILTNLTYEHSAGFQEGFDLISYRKIKDLLPEFWHQIFEDDTIDSRLKNIALEEFKLLTTATNYIIPASLGNITNQIITNTGLVEIKATRGENFRLVAQNRYNFDDNFLLPQTFAKNAVILETVATQFNLEQNLVDQVISDLDIPNGRFGVLEGRLNTTIIDSTYNSDPASLQGFLDLFEEVVAAYKNLPEAPSILNREMAVYPKHYLILGEMRELGSTALYEHQNILKRLVELGTNNKDYIQEILLLGREWLACDEVKVAKVDGDVTYISYQKQIFKIYQKAGHINKILTDDLIRPRSWFWVKGSQNTIFGEIIVKHLLAKKQDVAKLCRHGSDWDEIRKNWK
jgi:UDP-N-acetylmuramyl pentapeptide synthase